MRGSSPRAHAATAADRITPPATLTRTAATERRRSQRCWTRTYGQHLSRWEGCCRRERESPGWAGALHGWFAGQLVTPVSWRLACRRRVLRRTSQRDRSQHDRHKGGAHACRSDHQSAIYVLTSWAGPIPMNTGEPSSEAVPTWKVPRKRSGIHSSGIDPNRRPRW